MIWFFVVIMEGGSGDTNDTIELGGERMSASNQPMTLYFRLRRTITVRKGTDIKLGMIASVVTQPDVDEEVKNMVIISKDQTYGEKVLIDLIDIIRKLQDAYPDVNVECFGEPQTLVFFRAAERKPHLLFAVIVWLLLFIGSGLAIMNFHTDVSMQEVHQKLYSYITGEQREYPLMLQIPYS